MSNAIDRRLGIMKVIENSVKKATLLGVKVDKEKLILEVQRKYGSDRRKALDYLNVFIKSGVFLEDLEGLSYNAQTEIGEDIDSILERPAAKEEKKQ